MKIATTVKGLQPFVDTPEQVISVYEDTGFRYLDYDFGDVLNEPDHWLMADNWKDTLQKIKQTADALGIRFVQAHGPNVVIREDYASDKGIRATIRAIEACHLLGISNMVVHSGVFPQFKYPYDSEAYFEANKPYFQALIPAMGQYQVHILLENTTIRHCVEGGYFPILAKDLNAMISYLNHPLFGAVWDVGHANIDGIDHEKEILELGSNLKAIHVHDNSGGRDAHQVPFMGTADYDSLMRGLMKSGFSGYFTLETKEFFQYRYHSPEGPLQNIDLTLKKETLSLMYSVCRYILSAYGVYEE